MNRARRRNWHPAALDRWFRPSVERLENRCLLTTILGLTTTNSLVRFDSDSPGTVTTIGPINGLAAGDTVRSIDFRPATGALYGFAINVSAAHLYLISPTGSATQIGGNIPLPVSAGVAGAETAIGVDFNPVADLLRVVGNNRDNFRLNAATGTVAGADTALNPGSFTVVSAAYTNNVAGAVSTTLYDIDISPTLAQLVVQGGNPVPPGASPDGGVLTPVGSLGITPSSPAIGFDIAQGTGTAYASIEVGGVLGLYTINLATGAATLVGPIGATLFDLSVAPATQLAVSGFPSPVGIGTAGSFTVTARDPFGLTVPGYSGTVHFTSSDPAAVLPANSSLTNGTGTFSATFGTQGTQSLTATDTRIATLTGSQVGIAVIPPSVFVTGADRGGGPDVKVFDGATHQQTLGFFAYNPAFTGGVRVATGDVNGDGTPDVITAAGPGGGPDIAIFDGKTGSRLYNFFAFNPNFTGGAFVGAGDINHDGFADIIVGADAGGGPNISVFSGKDNARTRLTSFFAYDMNFTGGVRVAGADVNGDGFADIICGAGPGGGPNVTVFSGADNAQTRLFSFFAFDQNLRFGISVGGGDVNGDGKADVMVGAGARTTVSVFSGANTAQLSSFTAFDANFLGEVRVAGVGAPVASLVAVEGPQTSSARGPLSSPQVRIFNALSATLLDSFFAVNPLFTGGLYVAGIS